MRGLRIGWGEVVAYRGITPYTIHNFSMHRVDFPFVIVAGEGERERCGERMVGHAAGNWSDIEIWIPRHKILDSLTVF